MTVSLKAAILERLDQKKPRKTKGTSSRRQPNRLTESKKFTKTSLEAPKKGDRFLYQGKLVVLESVNTDSGMAVVLRGKSSQLIVRMQDLVAETLMEGVLGMAPVLPTWKDAPVAMVKFDDITADDIGLVFEADKDDDADDHDNGSNVNSTDGKVHKDVVDLPTPSDTIATAYSDEKPPKEVSSPLSIEPGHTVAKDPDLDGYDYPADAPEIPRPDFQGDEAGNSRPPNYGSTHDGGDNLDKRTDESSLGFDHIENRHKNKKGFCNVGSIGKRKYGKKISEAFSFITEMDDLLGSGEDQEPNAGATITLTLPAMASVVCTMAGCEGDETLMRAVIEALAEVGSGKTIDTPDLQAVAAHVNGEEAQEVQNRDAGRDDHAGIASAGDESARREPADTWPGDGEKTRTGKTKVMDCDMKESGGDYYGLDDIVAESRLTDEEEIRLIKRRAGLKFW